MQVYKKIKDIDLEKTEEIIDVFRKNLYDN